MIRLNNRFQIGDRVYIKVDKNSTPYTIIAMRIFGETTKVGGSVNVIQYELQGSGSDIDFRFEFEMCDTQWETAENNIGA